LQQFPPPAFSGALLAPSFDTRALVKGTLTEGPECAILRNLSLEATESPIQLSIPHAHAHLTPRMP
jgi:hypothetical protein